MPAYILRHLDPVMWGQFKARAAAEGWPLKAVMLALLQGYINGTITLTKATAEREGKP